MAKKYIENLIRIANTDIDGDKQVIIALTSIKGVGIMFSNAICKVLKLDKFGKALDLGDDNLAKIEALLEDPIKAGIPVWMLNRRNEPETGEDKHISTTDVRYVRDEDIKVLKKMKSYIGLRHQWGLPVRGQRTKSNFRKNKGKVASVKRKK